MTITSRKKDNSIRSIEIFNPIESKVFVIVKNKDVRSCKLTKPYIVNRESIIIEYSVKVSSINIYYDIDSMPKELIDTIIPTLYDNNFSREMENVVVVIEK